MTSPGPLIVGAGPVGMLTALKLAQMNVPSTLCEMNTETTRWPKMDLTNCRSMEYLRMMGLANEYRRQPGTISPDTPSDTLFYNTCGPEQKIFAKWVRLCFEAP